MFIFVTTAQLHWHPSNMDLKERIYFLQNLKNSVTEKLMNSTKLSNPASGPEISK